ncbi:MAG TPA: glutamate synthase large subunit [Phycisphaerae bacterium]|nr:glutamate synthase large subunit [Phycisphaerae bacterium]
MLRPQDVPTLGLYEARREHDACGIGAVVRISGRADHEIVAHARGVLTNLVHRGAAGGDETTGDGAGMLVQIPHAMLLSEATRLKIELPPPGGYGVGMIFEPQDKKARQHCEKLLVKALGDHGLKVLAWRDVPTDADCLGETARLVEPFVRQVIVAGGTVSDVALERKLYLARRRAERMVAEDLGDRAADFYICSLSCRTLIYKGMFHAAQLFGYYADLTDERVTTALAIVHQRYSTNTFPNWRLAQPFRMIAHNGEFNTLSGNANRMLSRQQHMHCDHLGDMADLVPVLTAGGSDSAWFDNVVELLTHGGRSLPHAIMMMIPEAFGAAYHISTDKRAFYEYHAAIMEPWDGPAAVLFTDGRIVGGTLDRNGLRPCRYAVTTDDLLVMASETGVVEFPPDGVRMRGRLQPGRMFLVDTVEGRIVTDNEIKSKISRQKPYRRWLSSNRIDLRGLLHGSRAIPSDQATIAQRMRVFGYTREHLHMILAPMARNGQEPLGSMGNDAALAVLSGRPRLLFDYFQQLFAQVTNPPIDPLREGLVMSLMTFTGKQHNLLAETPEHCRQLKLSHPILTNDDMDRLRDVRRADFSVGTVDALFDAETDDPGESLKAGLDELVRSAAQAIDEGASLVIVSDRNLSATRAPIPSLLAVAAVHHGLLLRGLRSEAGLVVESGEVREVMHYCLLCGYGASAINPYLALEIVDELQREGELPSEIEPESLIDNMIAAVKKGILKTMSKMGISTLRSYCGAQLFEAIGISRGVIDDYFTGTSSRIGGIGLAEIAAEALAPHRAAYVDPPTQALDLDYGGEYHFRTDGERHLWTPQTISCLQHAVRLDDAEAFEQYARAINDQSTAACTLRGLFEFAPGKSVGLEDVEPASEIVKRFCTGAMSHGSISKEAHETLAAGMNRLGAASNTGEGGEDPARYEPSDNGDVLNCVIKQVASGRFGVTVEYLSQAKELQIKMAQGAKPGEGGQLPGHKVTDEIARLRHSTPGVTLISPPPHHDIYSIEDLAQLIYDLKCANPDAEVSVKLVAEVGVGTIAAGVVKGGADEVLISGHDGGTGASPLSSIKHAGVPWELGLAETQQTLMLNGLRDRVRVQVDGQLKTGRDVVIGAMLGGERFGFGTAALVALGCVMMRKCHLGTCPVGIGTQDVNLRKRFTGQPEHLERFMLFVAEEVRRLMAELGFRRFDDMVGRADRLNVSKAVDRFKTRGLDLGNIFAGLNDHEGVICRRTRKQNDRTADHLDHEIIKQAAPAIDRGKAVVINLPVRNLHRSIGAMLSNRIVRKWGPKGLKDGTIEINLTGSAGQSLGAFLAPGVTLRVLGDANDYVGKGLSGGRIVLLAPDECRFMPCDNVIAGNTLLYGATSGEVFINGMVGERFAVRNSGVTAVVEGIGDHGCEYMTGGVVVVLGQTGRNFAAGMSGGVAYVFDEYQLFDTLCNLDTVDLENVWQEEDRRTLHELISQHAEWARSRQAKRILRAWPDMVGKFVKVIPLDYRQVLQRMRDSEDRDTDTTPVTEEVFRG